MMGRYIVPFLAVIGFVLAVGVVFYDNRPPPAALPAIQSAKAPFPSYIAGAGITEASTENVAVGTQVSGVVTNIYVKRGDTIKSGDPLFTVDDRDLQAQLLPTSAKVKEAEANLAKAKDHLDRASACPMGTKVPSVLRTWTTGALMQRLARRLLLRHKLWVEQIKREIEIHTVRALVSGRILQINIHPGEYAQSGVLASPLILLGDDSQMHVRVNIDENDSWRFKPDASAMAFIRGNPALKTPLRFVRIDPYVVPKTSLTSDSPERTDMRVLQVIYSYDPATLLIGLRGATDGRLYRSSTKRGGQTLNAARGYKNACRGIVQNM
jgi:HlyD family secretion protein